jgi:glutamate synthase domain-containing protein 3
MGQRLMARLDLDRIDIRQLNRWLQGREPQGLNETAFEVLNPRGRHTIGAGIERAVRVQVAGHTGYYCAGMNKRAEVTIDGNAGPGVGENMMSGVVRVRGYASQSSGASGHGGLLVIEGDASARCGISMKGNDIVVGGSVGHLSGFMGQAGTLVVCGDAEGGLGDSLYEAAIYVRGRVENLGADCVEKEMGGEHRDKLAELLEQAGMDADPGEFRRFGSARNLYHFDVEQVLNY